MRVQQCGPRRRLGRRGPENCCDDGIIREPFPLCKLFGHRIVDAFPPRCPLASPIPLTVLAKWQDAGWAQLLDAVCGNTERALSLLERVRICETCCARNSNHPCVQQLRRMFGGSDRRVLREPAPPADSGQAGPPRVVVRRLPKRKAARCG